MQIWPTIISVIVVMGPLTAAAAPAPAFEGKRLYTSYCMLCHGSEGKGDGALAEAMEIYPADLSTTVRSRSDTILRKIITGEGRQTITGRDRHNLLSDNMPEWKDVFSPKQISALIAWLRFLSTSRHELMGDPMLGYTTYEQYCAACHGTTGEGDGIMTQIMKLEPADHSNPNAMNKFSNEELYDIVMSGAGQYMPSWDGILSSAEVEGLVSYMRLLTQ